MSINWELYKSLLFANSNEVLAFNNDNEDDNASALKAIFDRSNEVIIYESEPVGNLTRNYPDLALSYKAFIDSGKSLRIIMPATLNELVNQGSLPDELTYISKTNPSNVLVKVVNQEFKLKMNTYLKGNDVDLAVGDGICVRVSEVKEKRKANILFNSTRYSPVISYIDRNFQTLSNFL